jgi:hypothetical protein
MIAPHPRVVLTNPELIDVNALMDIQIWTHHSPEECVHQKSKAVSFVTEEVIVLETNLDNKILVNVIECIWDEDVK